MRSRSLAALALFAVLAGCDSGDPVAPQVDVDAALAEMTLGAGAYGFAGGYGGGMALPSAHASDCAYDAPSGFFKCAPMTSNGITFTRQFQLLDATGAPLSTVNPLAVASIHSVTDVNGSVTNSGVDGLTLSITRHDDATLTGVQSTSRVLNGKATSELIATLSGDRVVMNDTTTTTALQLPYTPLQKYPLGGTVVSSGAIQDNAAAAEKYRIEVSFDGSSIVTIKSTVGGLTSTCKFNMASPDAEPVCT